MEKNLNYPKVLVGLDYSDMDDAIIDYCEVLLAHFKVTAINFIHVVPQWIVPTSLTEDPIQGFAIQPGWKSRLRSQLEEKIAPIRKNYPKVYINLQIVEGKPYIKLLLAAKAAKVDLLVVGNKKLSGGSGIQAKRVAKNLSCDLCFVPEQPSPVIRRILVPVDFSSYSCRALQSALELKQKIGGVQVVALHVIPLPSVSYSLHKDSAQLIEKLHDHAKQNYRSFIDRENLPGQLIEFKVIINEHYDVGRHIQEEARQIAANLLIIGAKGDDSSLSDFVFGSVTEKLVSLEDHHPILVIR